MCKNSLKNSGFLFAHEIFISALAAAKVQIPSIVVQMNTFPLGKIDLADWILNHDIIDAAVLHLRKGSIYRPADLFHKLSNLEKSIQDPY